MLEIWVSTIFTNNRLSSQCLFQVFDLVFVFLTQNIEPSWSHKFRKAVSLSIVSLDIISCLNKDWHIFGWDNPFFIGLEIWNLNILSVGLVESIDMTLCLVFLFKLFIAWKDIFDLWENCVMIVLVLLWKWVDIFVLDGFEGWLADIKEFLETLSAPVSFLFVTVPNQCVSSSDVWSEERMFNVHLVFIRASCVHAVINDGEIFILDMLIGDFLDGVGVFVDGFVHLLRISNDLFQLSYSSELLLLLFSSYRVSIILMIRSFLVWFFLHDLFW